MMYLSSRVRVRFIIVYCGQGTFINVPCVGIVSDCDNNAICQGGNIVRGLRIEQNANDLHMFSAHDEIVLRIPQCKFGSHRNYLKSSSTELV